MVVAVLLCALVVAQAEEDPNVVNVNLGMRWLMQTLRMEQTTHNFCRSSRDTME